MKKSQYNSAIHKRKSIRFKNYDYSKQGLYFITICSQNRLCVFGEIRKGEVILSPAGEMITSQWLALKNRFQNIELHEFVIMPDHFHGILEIKEIPLVGSSLVDEPCVGQPQGIVPTRTSLMDVTIEKFTNRKTVGDMIGAFKSITTVEYINGVKNSNWKPFSQRLWQRNYWEHIIRSQKSFNNISKYISDNPKKWEKDKLNNENPTLTINIPNI